MEIEKIDQNFKIANLNSLPIAFFNATEKPFKLEGLPLFDQEKIFTRIPEKLTEKEINLGVLSLKRHTTGAVIRFKTNSKYLGIKATLAFSCDMNHMTRTGSSGFALYTNSFGEFSHRASVQINPNETQIERILVEELSEEMSEYMLYLPLYGGVECVEIGVEPDAKFEEVADHKIEKPILFYGSSITQGGCASRPGNNYSSLICREVDAEEINLGFSGSAKGEVAIAEYINSLDLSCFVLDYDYNAPTAEHLQETHEKFFKIVRDCHPNLPIVMLTGCNVYPFRDMALVNQRRDIIKQTYLNAIANGDKNIYFIDGKTLFGKKHVDACTVDCCHPNDLGFYRMFENSLPTILEALGK